ncbi:ankyrin repeat-containing protein BDA1-like [Syzygium oleosum]|uniref:ankyrin repeat-containing protein BDA1-like n=1 Tax=Syzygium oleosum TaxID=219896 RepID=UPI0024B9AF98|nr:ankyrin repeat-containing protein BDA1-like [Syzygium oleosum]
MAAVEGKKKDRESRLQVAIANDDVNAVHNLIVEEPELLDRVSEDPFPNTPLHLAAAAGKTQVAMEMAILKPSFARKLNPEGYSPMHLALQHKHYHSVRALMTLDPKLIRVRGRFGITPLHYVAEKEGNNELELLAEFLFICKSSIEDLTSRCETAVHVAVKHRNLEAFKVLFGWLKRLNLTEILNWKDEDGNTVLDIAMSEEITEISDLLTRFQITDRMLGYVKLVKAKNFRGETAREISQGNASGDQELAEESRPPTLDPSLSQILRSEPTFFEKYAIFFGLRNESARDIILLVAALIATATYQAALTPPGGYWQDNSSNPPANSTVVTANSSGTAVEKPHKAGNIIMSGEHLYLFTALNSMVFLVSIFTIWTTAMTLLPHTWMVYGLMAFICCAYFTTLTIEFPNPNTVGGWLLTLFYAILLLVVVVVPLQFWLNQITLRRRIDATCRRVGNFQEMKDRK